MSAQLLEVSLFGVGTVLPLERHAWRMVKRLMHAANEYAPTPTSMSDAFPFDATGVVSLGLARRGCRGGLPGVYGPAGLVPADHPLCGENDTP